MNVLRIRRIAVSLFVCVPLLLVSVSAYDDVPPEGSDYMGALYLVCDTAELGSVTIYLPVTYQVGYFGFTSSGNVRNISNSSVSGVLIGGGGEYTVRFSSWSTPQYRDTSGSSYSYYDLTITSISASNIEIAEEFPPLVSPASVYQWIPVIFLGVIMLCLFMKRF